MVDPTCLCVIDTNVLLYAEQGLSAQAQRLLRRCSTGKLIGIFPQSVWQNLTHKLMLAEAVMLGRISGRYPAVQLTQKPDAVKKLTIYQEKIAALQKLCLGFELQRKYGLMTNDSVVLVTALRLGADVLVSLDAALRRFYVRYAG